MDRKPYCPTSGCGMPNGAAPPCPVKCKNCGYGTSEEPYMLTNMNRVCPVCKYCLSCGRKAKKYYSESPETDGNALYNAILLKPHDLAPRLAYADWLTENEGEFGQNRSIAILEQIEKNTECIVREHSRPCPWIGVERRGFIDEVEITLIDFMVHSPVIALEYPVTKWVLTDVFATSTSDAKVMYVVCDNWNNRLFWYEIPNSLASVMEDMGHPKSDMNHIYFNSHKEETTVLRQACFQYARIPLLKKLGAGTLRD